MSFLLSLTFSLPRNKGRRGGGEVAQTMDPHMNKCKNNKKNVARKLKQEGGLSEGDKSNRRMNMIKVRFMHVETITTKLSLYN
jgi:hypothetical protein